MIERLIIHHFRGIRQGILDDLGKVNLLIGPNNSGKTAILEMLYLGGTSGRAVQFIREDLSPDESVFAATTSLPADFLGLSPLPRLRARHGKSAFWPENPAILTGEGGLQVNLAGLPNANGSSAWESFRLGAPLETWGVKQSVQFNPDDIGQVAIFTLTHADKIHVSMIPPYFEEAGVRPEETCWHYLWQPDWVHLWERQTPIDRLAVWAEAGRPPQAERVLFFDFHTTNAHFTQEFAQWAKDQAWDWTKLLGDRLARIFPDLKGAKIEVDDAPDGQKGESGYIRRGGKGRLPIDQYGDGARHAFKVLAGLVALAESVDEEHPGMFLWEDPELFMHSATLGRLLDEVIEVVHNRPIQVFFSTQSLEVLAWLTKYLERNSQKSDLFRTFALHLQDGVLQTQTFKGKALGRWLDYFGDPRMLAEDETDSPLSHLLRSVEET